MAMLQYPADKYPRFKKIPLPGRQWPDQEILQPPVWCSVDLRDGNQALIEPMDPVRKQTMFDQLVQIGFKEIEVGFPSASQTDFDFVRQLIEQDLIPEDVTIQVLTQARQDLIERTFEAVRGAPRVILHLYHATAPVMRDVVFNMSRDEVKQELAVRHVRMVRELAAAEHGTDWTFQYSPEMFSNTELDYACEVVDAVTEAWAPTRQSKCIINLPSTVECCTPSTFADMIEWMHTNLARRDAIVLSVHPHNDRGTGTASAELALMAGADRLEGCLFGNGERTGNLDLVNVALNLYTQGVHPQLDLSEIDTIRSTVEYCNQLPVHPRHPYVGDLVYTSFSGSHQDAIKKTLGSRNQGDPWCVPYLPIDPEDLGRSYQAVIRVNSQSGKGGITYLLEQDYGMHLPRRAQIEFSQVVQRVMDDTGGELSSSDIWSIFESEFIRNAGPFEDLQTQLVQSPEASHVEIVGTVTFRGKSRQLTGKGETLVYACLDAVRDLTSCCFTVVDVTEHPIVTNDTEQVAAYVELRNASGSAWHGIGIATTALQANSAAVQSALNRPGVAMSLKLSA